MSEQAEFEAAQVVADIDLENTADTIGRAGKFAYNSVMGNGRYSLVNILQAKGYSHDAATAKAAEIFTFAYESGRKGYNRDVMLNAVSNYIAKGNDVATEAIYAFESGINR